MNYKFRSLIFEAIEKLPNKLQRIVFKIIIEIRFLKFRLKMTFFADKNIPNPSKIYWISPEKIVHHTNYLKNKAIKSLPLHRRVFPPEMRGRVLDGDWDVTNLQFTDLIIYKSLKERIKDGKKWQETELYKTILNAIRSGRFYWDIHNRRDLNERCNYLDSLYESIRENGFRINRNVHDKTSTFDEIDVNIGRNGEYLFQNGAHRLSIAKILGIKYVPVMIFVRHKEWQEFKEYVVSYAKQQRRGKLYQPIIHPDLADVPYYDEEGHNCGDIMKTIKPHLKSAKGIMLDIGANIGFFCHKFEDLGYKCCAVENDPITFRILEKIRIAENKKFEVIDKSIFEVELIKNIKFDVVLALNIFHHFLKTKTDFVKLKKFLRDLKTNQLFFEPHKYGDTQMKNAFVNFTENEFVDFVMKNTSLHKTEVIYTAKNGRKIFKLSK